MTTGWNLPPGCNVSDLPGERPEDVAWCHYWEDTDRPEIIWIDLYPDIQVSDYYDQYEKDKEYAKAIDRDFEKYLEQ